METAGALARTDTKIKTRQRLWATLRFLLCRSNIRRAALTERQEKRVPARIPEGLRTLILLVAEKLKKPAPDGGWVVSAKAIEATLRKDFHAKASVPTILKETKEAGFKIDKGGQPRNASDQKLAEVRYYRDKGMSLQAIGATMGITRQRVHTLLAEADRDDAAEK